MPIDSPEQAVTETAVVADAPAAAPAPDAPVDKDAAAVAAFDKGMVEVPPEDAPVKVEEAKPADDKPAAEAKPDGKDGKDAKVEEKHDDIEKEITELGLKEKTAARFRELATRPTEAEVTPLRERAAKADEWERVVTSTGATPEQFGTALNYLSAINSGDPKLMGPALDNMVKEVEWLAGKLGREVPGASDPLKAHTDLAREVEEGQLTRARALEIINQRALAERNGEQAQRFQQEQQHRQTVDQAMTNIAALNEKLKTSDPAFLQKLPLLQPALEIIRGSLPPNQWAAAVERAYLALPAMAPPPPKPSVAAVPLRPTGNAPAAQVRVPKNDAEAFDMGVASVR